MFYVLITFGVLKFCLSLVIVWCFVCFLVSFYFFFSFAYNLFLGFNWKEINFSSTVVVFVFPFRFPSYHVLLPHASLLPLWHFLCWLPGIIDLFLYVCVVILFVLHFFTVSFFYLFWIISSFSICLVSSPFTFSFIDFWGFIFSFSSSAVLLFFLFCPNFQIFFFFSFSPFSFPLTFSFVFMEDCLFVSFLCFLMFLFPFIFFILLMFFFSFSVCWVMCCCFP